MFPMLGSAAATTLMPATRSIAPMINSKLAYTDELWTLRQWKAFNDEKRKAHTRPAMAAKASRREALACARRLCSLMPSSFRDSSRMNPARAKPAM